MQTPTTARALALLLLVLAAGPSALAERLTILHINDLHARLLADDQGRGGFAHVATAIELERAKSRNAIVLHAGDMVQGSPVSSIFEGGPVFEVANTLGIDAHCLGNHEFDYGWERIRKFVELSAAPIVSANVLDDRGEGLLEPAVVLDAGSVKVAVIGALTPRLPSLVKPGQIGPWIVHPLVESLRGIVREMEDRADVVVVLGHLFDDEDEEILRELEGVDVLVGGHDHGGRDVEFVHDGRIGVKLRPYGRELGRLELDIDDETGQVVKHSWRRIPIRADSYDPHPETAALVDHWESKVSERVDVRIARCERLVSRDEVKGLVELAIRETTGADLAYMNRGGVRDSLRQGEILARHIWNILPFDNTLVEARVRGSDLPTEAVGANRVDPQEVYQFVTNDYVAGLPAYRHIDFHPTDHVMRDTFLEWVRSKGKVP